MEPEMRMEMRFYRICNILMNAKICKWDILPGPGRDSNGRVESRGGGWGSKKPTVIQSKEVRGSGRIIYFRRDGLHKKEDKDPSSRIFKPH